jgi:hypothetical protein
MYAFKERATSPCPKERDQTSTLEARNMEPLTMRWYVNGYRTTMNKLVTMTTFHPTFEVPNVCPKNPIKLHCQVPVVVKSKFPPNRMALDDTRNSNENIKSLIASSITKRRCICLCKAFLLKKLCSVHKETLHESNDTGQYKKYMDFSINTWHADKSVSHLLVTKKW